MYANGATLLQMVRLLATFWHILLQGPEGIDEPLANSFHGVSEGFGNFCQWPYFVSGLPIFSGLLSESSDYPIEQLAK